MSNNAFEIVVKIPKSDRFHSRDDRHLAEIVKGRIENFLRNDPPQWNGASGSSLRRVEPETDLSKS